MKIHGLSGENMMRMKRFDITFDEKGNTIIVAGKNGEGKSSFINSFVLGLGGSKTDVAKLTTKPIREGEKEAWVEVDLGEYTVRRVWKTNDKDDLKITGKNGSKFPSPQKMLDKILGDLSFDPLAFTRMKPKEQRELLLSIVELPIDLEAHEAEYAANFEKRTLVGRERDRLKGAWDSAMEAATGEKVPDEEESVTELAQKLTEANQWNNKVASMDESLVRFDAEITRQEENLKKLKTERDSMLEELLAAAKKMKSPEGELPWMNTKDLEQRIKEAETTNAAVRAKKSRAELKKQYEEQEARYEKGTKYLAKLDADKADALSKAEMPVDGLSLDADGVTFNGIPFGQLSMSQKIKVSTAIGMAQNPELRVMIVNDGSLLDKDNLKALSAMAEANDFQIFVEMVDDDAETGIIIEDGEIVSPKKK